MNWISSMIPTMMYHWKLTLPALKMLYLLFQKVLPLLSDMANNSLEFCLGGWTCPCRSRKKSCLSAQVRDTICWMTVWVELSWDIANTHWVIQSKRDARLICTPRGQCTMQRSFRALYSNHWNILQCQFLLQVTKQM